MTRDRSWQRTTAGLAAAAAAIGAAVVFALGGAGVPEPARGSPVPANDDSAPAVAAASGAAAAESTARAPAAVSARALRIRVLQRFGKTTTHYTGPLRIVAGDDELLATTLRNGQHVALEVAGDATGLRFEAPGFVACDVALRARDADAAVLEVVFVPDAGLRFRFIGRNDGGAGETAIRVLVFAADVTAASELRARAGTAEELDVPMLRDRELRWCAQWQDGGRWCEVRGVEPPLAGGERRRVVADFAAVQMERHVVVGPSRELLPHLCVTWKEDSGAVSVPLDADGVFERAAAVTSPVRVSATGSSVELSCDRDAQANVWRPLRPLLGVGLVDAAGALVATTPLHASGDPLGGAARVHVFARESVPQPLGLVAADEAPRQFAIDRSGARDLVLVTAADAIAPTRLVVEVTGDPPAESVRRALTLCVRGGANERPLARAAAPRLVFDLPRGGDYTLVWQCSDGSARDAATVRATAGREQVATVAWPAVCAWTGEVEGWDELPAVRRWHRIGFGESAQLRVPPHRVDERGRFELVRFADRPPCEPATLGWGLVPVAARIAVCDESSHHVVVQLAETLRWIDVDVEALRPWRLLLYRAGAPGAPPRIVHVLSDRQQLPVPLAGTEPLSGALFEGDGTAPIAWCELRGDATRVTVRAEPLRRVEVRARTARAGRQVYLVGPSGQWDLGHELATTDPQAFDAPATTRGVAVCEPGAATREFPLPASGAVAID